MAKLYKSMTRDTAYKPMGVLLERANALKPFSEATGILDNGCGPGPVMARLLENYKVPDSCSLTCSDFSEGMIKAVEGTKEEEVKADSNSPWSRLEAVVQNAMELTTIDDSSKSHVTAGWVYFMTPDPQKCLSESKRVLEDGGVLACSAWEGSQWMDLMAMLPQVRPDKKFPEMPKEWMNVDAIKGELEKAGFNDVESHRVATQMAFEKAESFVEFTLTKMPHMVMLMEDFSQEETAQLKALLTNKIKEMSPSEPGKLSGTALVAVGKK